MSLLSLFGGAGVALSAKAGTFACDTDTGAQSVTGVGFEPKLVVVFGNSATAVDTVGTVNRWSFGAASAANAQNAIMGASDNGAATMVTGRGLKTDALIYLPATGTPTDDGIAALTGFTADGFDLDWSDAPAAASIMHYLALGGSDVSNVKVGNFVASTSTGVQSVTDPGFRPGVVIFFWTGQTAAGSTDNHSVSFGAATNTDSWSWSLHDEDTPTTSNVRLDLSTTTCLIRQAATTIDASATFAGMTDTGFDINWSDAPAAASLISYIAIKGPAAKVGTYAGATSDITVNHTGVGFTPRSLFVTSVMRVATGAVNTADFRPAWGVASGASAEGHIAQVSEDNAGTSNVRQVTDDDKLFAVLTNAGARSNIQDLQGFTSDGFDIAYTSSVSAIIMPYVAFGDHIAEGSPSRRLLLGVG